MAGKFLDQIITRPGQRDPPENFSVGFSFCPGSRRIQFLPGGIIANHAFAASGCTSSR